MNLFLFYDDIEEILVSAADRNDAFTVIEEQWGSEAADALILSRLRDLGPTSLARKLIRHEKPGTFKKGES